MLPNTPPVTLGDVERMPPLSPVPIVSLGPDAQGGQVISLAPGAAIVQELPPLSVAHRVLDLVPVLGAMVVFLVWGLLHPDQIPVLAGLVISALVYSLRQRRAKEIARGAGVLARSSAPPTTRSTP